MKFNFSIDPDGELDGNDASQEHFTGHRLTSVAREIGQNTNDARSEAAIEEGKPAVVAFERIDVPADQIPDLNGLKEKLNGCLEYAENHLENDEYAKFYKKAIQVISKKHISVLRVSDWNTRGLEGPFEGATPVIAFAKGKGISKKSTVNSGGSRGIGKNAIFTISELRTSFFSTYSLNKKSGKREYLSQGKAVLISDLKGKKIRKGTGYCGLPNAEAIVGEKEIPDWMKRSGHVPVEAVDQSGLSLFALGFNQGPNWHLHLAASAITTFFSAIQQGFIEFRVIDGENNLVINRESYLGFFDNLEIVKPLDAEEIRHFDKAKVYAKILEDAEAEDPSVVVEQFENPKVGNFKLCIRVQDGMPRNVALIRTGMLITESMPNLKRFSGKDFAAVLQAQTEKGMAFLRSLEGAEHNALEPDRIDDKATRNKAKKTLDEVTRRAREILDKHIRVEAEDADDIDELAQYFPYEMGQGEEDKEKNELNPLGKLMLVPKPAKKSIKFKPREGENSDSTGGFEGDTGTDTGESGSGSGAGNGSGAKDKSGDKPTNKRESVGISNIRAPLLAESKIKRRVSFTIDGEDDFELALFIAGADHDDSLAVKDSSLGVVHEGKIRFSGIKKNQRLSTDVELQSEFSGAIKAFAYKLVETEEDSK